MAEVAHARPATPAHVSHSPHSAQNHAARAIERQSKRGGLKAALERDPPPSCTDTAEDLPAPPTRRPASTADESCPAWTSEREAAGVQQKRQPLDWRLKRKLDNLVTHWLRPFGNGVWPENLRTYPPSNRTATEFFGLGEGRHCPLVSVISGQVFIEIPEGTRFWTLRFTRCSSSSEGGRQLTVLRLLFLALRRRKLPDFQFRLCSDDYCHGLHEAEAGVRARPLFTSVSCETTRKSGLRVGHTLPSVQWNTLAGRDPDLGEWDAAVNALLAQRQSLDRLWDCRQPKAVWRGSIAQDAHVYNVRWSSEARLAKEKVGADNWFKAGRLALAHQKCLHPDLLDIRFKLLRQKHFDANCTYTASRDKPKVLSMSEQAHRFRYMVHVEGIAGWADRLRHVLLSGATVLKQEMGVSEWFEPLLKPWQHYVPVSSTLGNLSDAVRWAQTHDKEARRIAANAASLIEGVLSEAAVVYYQTELFSRYAALWRGDKNLQRPVARSLGELKCSVRPQGKLWDTECALLNPDTGEDSWVPPNEPRRRLENFKHLWLARAASSEGNALRQSPARTPGQLQLNEREYTKERPTRPF